MTMSAKKIEEFRPELGKLFIGQYAIGYWNGEDDEDFYRNTIGVASTQSEAEELVNSLREEQGEDALFWKESSELIGFSASTGDGGVYVTWLITEENFCFELMIDDE